MRVVTIIGALVLLTAARAESAVIHIISAEVYGSGDLTDQSYSASGWNGLHTIRVSEDILPSFLSGSPIDLVITVTREACDSKQVIGLDKFTNNTSGRDLGLFEMTLGRGTGDGFVRSGEGDALYFGNSEISSPLNKVGVGDYGIQAFANPPAKDEVVSADRLTWHDGVLPNGYNTSYGVGVVIPDAFFTSDDGGFTEIAQITVRQTTHTPEPASVATFGGLIGIGILASWWRRRRGR